MRRYFLSITRFLFQAFLYLSVYSLNNLANLTTISNVDMSFYVLLQQGRCYLSFSCYVNV